MIKHYLKKKIDTIVNAMYPCALQPNLPPDCDCKFQTPEKFFIAEMKSGQLIEAKHALSFTIGL